MAAHRLAAQSPIVPEEEIISTDSTGETQDIHIVVEQDQKVDTGGTADDIQQEQDTNINRSQDQSTPHEVEYSEESEMIVNESTEKSEYSKQNDAPEFNQTYNQEQSVEVLAEQKQKVTQAEKVDAEQEQNVTLEYSQFLKVIKTGGQSQRTKIMTEQDQSVTTDDDADYVEQMVRNNYQYKTRRRYQPSGK